MKRIIVLITALFLAAPIAKADEGMWLLQTLKNVNLKDMQSKGLKLSADDIYSANKNSLKDAIVIFGQGCTGEIVSADGLIFTNHHCGYGNIQSLSSVEHDYLKNGFWAMNRQEEIHAPGLTVRFIRSIEDVTAKVLKGVTDSFTRQERNEAVKTNITALQEEAQKNNNGLTVQIKDFFGGNQYLMFLMEEYTDIRLVGTPPSSIGKFGGDTDNWMWPRHTGDFSVFRVYADKNGRPAEYSTDNIPYKAPKHLKVSLKGIEKDDFTMIMGFPGSTNRYMTSYEIDRVLAVDNPDRILVRGERQQVLKKQMDSSDEIRIKYASKYASSSNYWKNSIGMSRGLVKLDVKGQKEAQEAKFRTWVGQDPKRAKYAPALDLIRDAVKDRMPYSKVSQMISETMMIGVEIIKISSAGIMLSDNPTPEALEKIKAAGMAFYKDFDMTTDRKVAYVMFDVLKKNVAAENLPSIYKTIDADFGGSIEKYVDHLYNNSVFATKEKFDAYVDKGDFEGVLQDPGVVLLTSVREAYNSVVVKQQPYAEMFREGHRLYIAGLLEMDKDKMHYPDANFTIRLTYGNVLPYKPMDAVYYDYYTTLSGVIAKEDPDNSEFTVPTKLKELYRAKDFGQYAYNGDVPVAFISNNDITGGNSGSPVLNAHGELIGLAFDGNWEAMSGDIAFEPDLQRCINVDIRYVLFIIDKFAGASHLIDELTIVK